MRVFTRFISKQENIYYLFTNHSKVQEEHNLSQRLKYSPHKSASQDLRERDKNPYESKVLNSREFLTRGYLVLTLEQM